MRAARLVSLLLLLQTRGRLTAAQLAGELEVSVRTIYRDVEALSEAGVPVFGDAGPAGGYQLLGGYRTRLTGLTQAEAQSLALAGLPAAAAELGLGTVLATAQLKLAASLPAELADQAEAVRDRFYLDAPGWYYDGDSAPFLTAVAGAVWEQRRIEIRYRRWKAPAEVTRTLEPHGIVHKAGKWYLVARTSTAEPGAGQQTYRISQILALTVLDEDFSREPGFDLARYWVAGVAQFRAGLYQGTATVRLSPRGRELTGQLLSSDVITAVTAAEAACAAAGRDPDDWITAVIPIETTDRAEQDLLRLGADVEVLEPASLRTRIATTALALAGRYAAG